ncbi:MAG: HEAT repeat domain-containing protein [Promethearchaeota archaeon]
MILQPHLRAISSNWLSPGAGYPLDSGSVYGAAAPVLVGVCPARTSVKGSGRTYVAAGRDGGRGSLFFATRCQTTTRRWKCPTTPQKLNQKALPILKEKLNHLLEKTLVDVASTLRKIENDNSNAEYIIRVLETDASFYNRLEAAIELRYFGTPEVMKALFDAVKDRIFS